MDHLLLRTALLPIHKVTIRGLSQNTVESFRK